MEKIIGLDIGGTKILGAVYDGQGNIVLREKKKTKAHEGLEVVMEQVYKVLDALIEGSKEGVKSIGVGVPGLVDYEGKVAFSPNIPFDDYPLKEEIQRRYKVPVIVGNDVNVAMFGEYKKTNNPSLHNVLGLFVGTGVGGAAIINGTLYLGQGSAGEFGHMVVNSEGAYCGCGAQGCLEAYSSKTAIHSYIQSQLGKGRKSVLKDLLSEDGAVIKSSSIRKAYDLGDALAIESIKRCGKYLGIAVGSLINIFHPQMIIFGGGIFEAFGDELLNITISEATLHAMPGIINHVEFKLSELGDDAGIYGAYKLAQSL